MRLLLSLTNAIGADRMRQATRELVKAYIHGLDSAALDDVFELLAWNQGIGYFNSEIDPSALFQAYKTVKNMERQGKDRSEICEALKEKFGEKNPDVKVLGGVDTMAEITKKYKALRTSDGVSVAERKNR